jgi:Mrp family chromosome partitioning ATPase
MAATGESYSVARRNLAAEAAAADHGRRRTASRAEARPDRQDVAERLGARVVALLNDKGGVGRTTIALRLARCLGGLGGRSLVIDLDPIGSLTASTPNDADGRSLAGVLAGRAVASIDELTQVRPSGLRVVPGWDLDRLDVDDLARDRFVALLGGLDHEVTVIVDCPNSVWALSQLGLHAVDAGGPGSGVLVVALPTTTTLNNATRRLGPDSVLGLVINQTRPSVIDASLHDVPRRYGLPVLARIPWDEDLEDLEPTGDGHGPGSLAIGGLAELLLTDPAMAGPRSGLAELLDTAAARDAELAELLTAVANKRIVEGTGDPEFSLGLDLLDDDEAHDRIIDILEGPDEDDEDDEADDEDAEVYERVMDVLEGLAPADGQRAFRILDALDDDSYVRAMRLLDDSLQDPGERGSVLQILEGFDDMDGDRGVDAPRPPG